MRYRRQSPWRSTVRLSLGATALTVAGLLAVAIPLGTTSAMAAEKPARLGVYYFGGWSGTLSNFHFTGLLSGAYTGRQPLYGWLDNTTQTMRTQLYWANRMGADFFNFLWYYRPESTEDPFLNRALGNYGLSRTTRAWGSRSPTRTSRPS